MRKAVLDLAIAMKVNIMGMQQLPARTLLMSKILGTPYQDFVNHDAKLRRVVLSRADRAPYKPTPFDRERAAKSGPTEFMIKDFYASWEWKRLSFDVKQTRGRVCECCGARAPAVKIITDHIKPLRKYWHLRLDRTNLQVLCDDCNMGKGSRDETDFRTLNAAAEKYPTEPDLTPEEELRLLAIRDQLRLN
jgi:5-methylcytosine-specific restriction endonuclease McrA